MRRAPFTKLELMTARDVLDRVEESGATLKYLEGKLKASGWDDLPPNLQRSIREQRDAIEFLLDERAQEKAAEDARQAQQAVINFCRRWIRIGALDGIHEPLEYKSGHTIMAGQLKRVVEDLLELSECGSAKQAELAREHLCQMYPVIAMRVDDEYHPEWRRAA